MWKQISENIKILLELFNMKVVILAGGEGRRLRPYTYVFPKPLLPIGDQPILGIILERLKKQGIKEAILATNYKDYLIRTFFGDGSDNDMKISYSKEEIFLGTAGPLKSLEEKLKEDFFVMNGDLLTGINVSEVFDFHKQNANDVTIVTKNVKTPINYGIIKNKDGFVTKWIEKPDVTSEISTGMYMLSPRVLKYIPQGKFFNMNDLVETVLKDRGKVLRFLYEGEWIDIGRLDEYKRAQLKFNKE